MKATLISVGSAWRRYQDTTDNANHFTIQRFMVTNDEDDSLSFYYKMFNDTKTWQMTFMDIDRVQEACQALQLNVQLTKSEDL